MFIFIWIIFNLVIFSFVEINFDNLKEEKSLSGYFFD